MKKVISDAGEYLLGIERSGERFLNLPTQFSEYTILLIMEGEGIYHADFGTFSFSGPVLLFSSPMQVIHIQQTKPVKSLMLRFHGDFYCIEYHRAEVACNGLLFNNIYLEPIVTLSVEEAELFNYLAGHMLEELNHSSSIIVLKAYLQLFLAKASSIKITSNDTVSSLNRRDELMESFKQLLDEHFLTLHRPNEYADLLAMSPNNLTKRCTRYFKKTPSQLIQERLILEAKKYLYLTRTSVKEIAFILKFQDESYFSRVFKKVTKVTPHTFRNRTGVSIVADLYQ